MNKNLFQKQYRIPTARLKKWDYSDAGYYFVTVCTYKKKEYFGEIRKKNIFVKNRQNC